MQRRNGMPDFRENGVIRCARLESKKSASGAVKKFCAAEWSRKMSRGVDSTPPPPGRFRVKHTEKYPLSQTYSQRIKPIQNEDPKIFIPKRK